MRKVLFVDDEVNIINALKRGLIDEDFQCLFANGGDEALGIMGKENIAVIVTDMRMPGMDGLTLLKIVKEKYPNTVRIVLSGYTQLPQVLATVNQADIFKFIPKPWNMEEDIINIVRQAIDYYVLQEEREIISRELEQKNLAYQNILKKTDYLISSVKKDTEILKHTGFDAFNCLDSIIQENKIEKVKEAFLPIKTLYLWYLYTLPNENKEFKAKGIIEDVESYLGDKGSLNDLELNSNINEMDVVKGNRNLYSFIYKGILETFLFKDAVNFIKIDSNIKEIKTGNYILESIILLSNRPDINEGLIWTIEERIKFVTLFLTEVIRPFNGSMKIAQVDGNIAVKFVLQLDKTA